MKLFSSLLHENQLLADGSGCLDFVEVTLTVITVNVCSYRKEYQPCQKCIREDSQMTRKDLQDILRINMSVLNDTLHNRLDVHKRCTRWEPHQLNEPQKGGRVQWCLIMLEKSDTGYSNSVWNIVSGVET